VQLEKRLQRVELERAARPWEAILGGLPEVDLAVVAATLEGSWPAMGDPAGNL
jgi:hypothetical protein